MNFGSDNESGACQQVIETLLEANHGFAHGYGDDDWTGQAQAELRRIFDCDLQAWFVATGTASNCLALASLTRPWEKVLCHDSAHLVIDESTAPEFFTGGARMVPISRGAGKLTADHVEHYLEDAGTDLPHHAQARVVSITQANELGLVYSPREIQSISRVCKQHGLKLHMDGARFSNAVVSQACTPAELTWKSGVDVLSLGATKCGALCAEAVIFFDASLSKEFIHHRKRSGHLLSKGRLFGAQMTGWLRDDHWLELARNANTQAAGLADSMSAIDGVRIVWPTEGNQVFATMPEKLADELRNAGAEFYEWYPASLPIDFEHAASDVFVRLVTSFSTRDEDRDEFIALMTELA
jgi:threonine aldolase